MNQQERELITKNLFINDIVVKLINDPQLIEMRERIKTLEKEIKDLEKTVYRLDQNHRYGLDRRD